MREKWLFPNDRPAYSIPDGVSIKALDGSDFDKAIAIARQYEKPLSPTNLVELVMLLKVSCKSRAEGERTLSAQMKAFATILGRYPADVAVEVVNEWTEHERFFPSSAELHENCKRKIARREAIVRMLKKREADAQDTGPKSKPTKEQIERMEKSFGIRSAQANA